MALHGQGACYRDKTPAGHPIRGTHSLHAKPCKKPANGRHALPYG